MSTLLFERVAAGTGEIRCSVRIIWNVKAAEVWESFKKLHEKNYQPFLRGLPPVTRTEKKIAQESRR